MAEKLRGATMWRNNKTGHTYTVLHIGKFTEKPMELEPVVVYTKDGKIWVRPVDNFKEKFTFVKDLMDWEENHPAE